MSLAPADRPQPPRPPAGHRLAKEVFDRVGAATLLLLTAPWLVLVALLLWLQDAGPVLVRTGRTGRWGRPFRLLHFRTGASGLGAALRRYHLDELPQLINVLKGDMSFVGPRPPAPGDRQDLADNCSWLSVKPGLLRPWPASRSPRSPEGASLELDRYLRHWSPTVDVAIVWRSLREAFHWPATGRGR
jgi:lipopolysaccharide/colanic/teichoic acid biosynthesis glycosyltransferase